MLSLGNIEITWLKGGSFELDGGTMFGAVPKVLWQKRLPADDENYIKFPNDPLLVRTEDFNIIIDTGLGNKLTEKQQKIFRVYEPWAVPESLADLGLKREDIHYVILTHGDFDHAGGVVMHNAKGEPELTFPAAKHLIQDTEWHDITNPNRRTAESYWPHNFEGLNPRTNLSRIKGDREIVPGVAVRLTGGHTRGHQAIEIRGSQGSAIHLGDALPTHTHTNPLWIMAYDNFPLDLIAQKEELISKHRKQKSWFTFYHDPFMRACRLDEDGKDVERVV